MAFTIYARMKRLGKQKKADLEVLPFVLKQKPESVKELLTELVELGVREYNERKESGQILPYLTKEQIQDKADTGKVSFGLHEGNDADLEKAVANAIQCFEDGIYRVFAGEDELTDLDQKIPWNEEENIPFSFVRLTMLSGW